MRKLMVRLFDKTFLKFIAVGVANTLFGTAIMFSLYNLAHCGYWFSSAANYICGSILSYFLNKNFTFKNQEHGLKVVLKFIINITVCYFAAYGMAKPFVKIILSGAKQSIQDNVSMLVGMGAFVIFNYFGQRFWAFKKDKEY